MDDKLTEKLRAWLETAPAERDYRQGAELLLRLSGNVIMHRNLIHAPEQKADFIEHQLQRYYNFRVKAYTHRQVEEMSGQVEKIVERHIPKAAKADAMPKGKRADHDSLPQEIQALYTENLDLLRRMREVHMRLRLLSTENSTCPDSERYPFLKELIGLDKQLRGNWEKYDTYAAPAKKRRTTRKTSKS